MKKIISFVMLILVASMIFVGVPSNAKAESNYDVLLRLISNAQTQVENQIKNNENPKIEKLYNDSLVEISLLNSAIEEDNVDSAREHFLLAMRIFSEITRTASERPTAQAEVTANSTQRDHSSNLERTKKYVDSLKSVAKKHGADINFTEIDRLFVQAREQIDEEKYDDAQTTINKLNRFVLDISKTLREYANQKETDRAQNYAQQYIEKIDRLISQAEGKVPENVIEKLVEAKEKLASTSDPDEVIKIVRQIISIEQEFDLTKANKLESRMMQLEKIINKLSDTAIEDSENEDDSDIDNLKEMISKIKGLISMGELDEANNLLHELNDKIKEIQTAN